MREVFNAAEETVRRYFSEVLIDPARATIQIGDERYVLMRASSLSVDFLMAIRHLYADLGDDEAFAIGRNFLFDIAHVIGIEDARVFHEKMNLTDPVERLATGPVHFAWSGWALVDISPESRPSPDADYFIKYDHPYSFEADSWIRAGQRSDQPVCFMNAGYSSGWCEQSFGVELTAVEISCRAAGDDACTFIMAPPQRIREYVAHYAPENHVTRQDAFRIPTFFERKRVEEEMKSARRKAEESDRMKSEFLTNISHEIRTPMNALIGMIELVLETPLAGSQREYLNTSLQSAESLMEIINQILDFSRIESGKMELAPRPFSLRGLIDEAMRPLEILAEEKGLKLSWKVADDVPDAVRGDSIRFRQVVVNLVGNALKFTENGGAAMEVRLERKASRDVWLHVVVKDTGIGIPVEKLESIFEAFTQVDMSTTRKHGGTGLGLSISSRLVDLMEGRIWAENNPLGGSTFHFTVRLELDAPSPHPELAGVPVVLVVDYAEHRTALERVLTKLQMDVVTAKSSHDALTLLMNRKTPRHRRHLLISDVKDNLILLESIRSRPEIRDTEAISLIARDDAGDVPRLEELGVKACLIKPIKQSELIAAIKQSLHSAKSPPIEPDRTRPGEQAVHVEPETAGGAQEKKAPGESGVRILLVEDGVTNQKFAVAMLHRWGHEVAIANNGLEALEMLDTNPDVYDLILMDVLMPVMDGLQATKEIRLREEGSNRRVPIVAITAQAMKEDRDRCLSAGMDDYLSKPIRRRDLQKIIAERVVK